MTKRARPEEEWVEATSEEIKGSNEGVHEDGTAVARLKPITVGPPVDEGETGTPKEVATEHVALDEMPGSGPFLELLALAGYKPW